MSNLRKLDTSKLIDPNSCQELRRAIEAALENIQLARNENLELHWSFLKEAVYSARQETLGHPYRKKP